MAVTLKYINPSGNSVTFHSVRLDGIKHPDYLLQYITGVGGPTVEYDDAPLAGRDGSYLSDARYMPRLIATGCMVYGETDAIRDRKLQELVEVLNPKHGDGELVYLNHDTEFRIEGRCKVLPSFGANTKRLFWKPVLIDYECSHPLWRGMNEYYEVLQTKRRFMLPFRFPIRLGEGIRVGTVYNFSAVDVPLRVIIHGPAINPQVINDTAGGSLMVRKNLLDGEELIIDTGQRKRVIIRDTEGIERDAINYVDVLNMQWVQLVPGNNTIRYASNDDSKRAKIELFWSDWYLGVG